MRHKNDQSNAFDSGEFVETNDGFIPDLNLPGDTQGETNGIYAGMTTNEISDTGMDYLYANPGTRNDFLSQATDFVRSLGDAAQSVSQTRTQVARDNRQTRQLSQPTLGEQWNALGSFEKFGFIAALIGLVYAFKVRR